MMNKIYNTIPEVGTNWLHTKSEMTYQVLAILNKCSSDLDKYPIMVAYRDTAGRDWCRPLSRWYDSMFKISTPADTLI